MLLKQDVGEAALVVDARLDFIGKEMSVELMLSMNLVTQTVPEFVLRNKFKLPRTRVRGQRWRHAGKDEPPFNCLILTDA